MDSAITAAWERVFEESKAEELAAYEAEGWLTFQDFATKAGLTIPGARCAVARLAREKRLESKKIRCHHAGRIREITICRPRI